MIVLAPPAPAGRASASPATPDCPGCPGEPLRLVQPDERHPEVLLGSCGRCGALWMVADDAEAVDPAAAPTAEPPAWRVLGRAGLMRP